MTRMVLFKKINDQECFNIYLANSIILKRNETHKWITNKKKKFSHAYAV